MMISLLLHDVLVHKEMNIFDYFYILYPYYKFFETKVK